MTISLIVAADENNIIGDGAALPWHLPADVKFFRDTTRGHTFIMGRRTFDSIGHPLPKRRNIIVTRQSDLRVEGCEMAHSIEQALQMAKDDHADEIFILGGGEIYRLALPLANRVYLTRVHTTVGEGVSFPELPADAWQETGRSEYPADQENKFSMTFLTYEKKK